MQSANQIAHLAAGPQNSAEMLVGTVAQPVLKRCSARFSSGGHLPVLRALTGALISDNGPPIISGCTAASEWPHLARQCWPAPRIRRKSERQNAQILHIHHPPTLNYSRSSNNFTESTYFYTFSMSLTNLSLNLPSPITSIFTIMY